jgi:hypothetical protein
MRLAASLLAASLAGCVAPGDAPVASKAAGPAGPAAGTLFTLRNPSFEAETPAGARCASGWNCTMHADPKSFRFFADSEGAKEGARSFCIEPVTDEPWAMLTQGTYDQKLRGTRVRFSLAVRLANVSGRGAGPWAQVRAPGRPGVETHQKMVQSTTGWETHSVEFEVPTNATTVEVGAQLRGRGRACFDDARLEILRGPKNPV